MDNNYIDYFKLDIEGAKHNVIKDIVADEIDIEGICLEVHYTKVASDLQDVMKLVKLL